MSLFTPWGAYPNDSLASRNTNTLLMPCFISCSRIQTTCRAPITYLTLPPGVDRLCSNVAGIGCATLLHP
jgi:hypothetical protein